MEETDIREPMFVAQEHWRQEPRWRTYRFLKEIEDFMRSPFLYEVILPYHRSLQWTLLVDSNLTNAQYRSLRILRSQLRCLTRWHLLKDFDPSYVFPSPYYSQAFNRTYRILSEFSSLIQNRELQQVFRRRLRRHPLSDTTASAGSTPRREG